MGRMRVAGWQALSVAAGLFAWEAAVRWGALDPVFVPAPSAVLRVFWTTASEILLRLGDTLVKTLLGYALAVCVGVPAGLLLGSRPTAHAVMPMSWRSTASEDPVLPWIALIFGIGLSWRRSRRRYSRLPSLCDRGGHRDVSCSAVAYVGATARGSAESAPAVPPSVDPMRCVVFALLGAPGGAGRQSRLGWMQRVALAFRAPGSSLYGHRLGASSVVLTSASQPAPGAGAECRLTVVSCRTSRGWGPAVRGNFPVLQDVAGRRGPASEGELQRRHP
jgi:hypothetical protein